MPDNCQHPALQTMCQGLQDGLRLSKPSILDTCSHHHPPTRIAGPVPSQSLVTTCCWVDQWAVGSASEQCQWVLMPCCVSHCCLLLCFGLAGLSRSP
jgi:hypothetical protein